MTGGRYIRASRRAGPRRVRGLRLRYPRAEPGRAVEEAIRSSAKWAGSRATVPGRAIPRRGEPSACGARSPPRSWSARTAEGAGGGCPACRWWDVGTARASPHLPAPVRAATATARDGRVRRDPPSPASPVGSDDPTAYVSTSTAFYPGQVRDSRARTPADAIPRSSVSSIGVSAFPVGLEDHGRQRDGCNGGVPRSVARGRPGRVLPRRKSGRTAGGGLRTGGPSAMISKRNRELSRSPSPNHSATGQESAMTWCPEHQQTPFVDTCSCRCGRGLLLGIVWRGLEGVAGKPATPA
jgi:hypothetical protein